MIDRPVLFSAPMIRAILSGRKTQTRRAVKPATWNFARTPEFNTDAVTGRHEWLARKAGEPSTFRWLNCPYGQPGDRLWVRESHWFFQDEHDPLTGYTPPVLTTEDVEYRADGESTRHGWRPSIHMPRWASRIALNVTGVRVEKLQAISETDAQAEGVHGPEDDVANNLPNCPQCGGVGLYTAFNPATGGALPDTDCERCDTPKKRFRLLWESINGAESWEANPWVWVVEFERAKDPA